MIMSKSRICRVWCLVVVLIVMMLAGCFDKEASQRKAFADFLQNTVMRSGETLPVLSADQKKQFANFIPYYQVLYRYSQQINQAMNEGIYPAVQLVNRIREPQDYVTHREALHQLTEALNVLNQQLANAKNRADSDLAGLKLADDLRPIYEQAYQKIVTTPANALQPLFPAAQSLTSQLVQVGDFIQQQGNNVQFVNNKIQFPVAEQVNQYNILIAPLSSQYQVFNQAYQAALNTLK